MLIASSVVDGAALRRATRSAEVQKTVGETGMQINMTAAKRNASRAMLGGPGGCYIAMHALCDVGLKPRSL
jgi:hypothetical protein